MSILSKKLHSKRFEHTIEPTISAGLSFIKPDLEVVDAEKRITFYDVTVVSDSRLSSAFTDKQAKYTSAANLRALQAYAATRNLTLHPKPVVPLVWTQRGFIHSASASALQLLGLSTFDIQHTVMAAICGSLRCYAAYYCTHRPSAFSSVLTDILHPLTYPFLSSFVVGHEV